MPIDFPASPTLNQIYNYTSGSDVRFHKSFMYNGTGWEEIINYPGVIRPFAAFYNPAGWLLCDGTAYSRTTYSALFKIISISTTGNTTISNATITNIPSTTNMGIGMPISGTNIQSATKISLINSSTSITMDKTATASGTGIAFVVAPFGVGDGTTTFNVPDFSKKTPIGSGTNGTLTNRVLGVSGGQEDVILTLSDIPSHTHTVTDSGHKHTGVTTANDHGHYHPTYTRTTGSEAGGYGLGYSNYYKDRVIVSSNYPDRWPGQIAQSVGHFHSFITSSNTSNTNLGYYGSDKAHPNMQPYLPLNFMIKY